jgi:hypothetical protein
VPPGVRDYPKGAGGRGQTALVRRTADAGGELSRNMARIYAALARPLDGQPPLFYVMEHIASRFTQTRRLRCGYRRSWHSAARSLVFSFM